LLGLSGAKAIITTPALAEAMEAAGGGRPLILTGAEAEVGGGTHLSLQKLLAISNIGAVETPDNPTPEAVSAPLLRRHHWFAQGRRPHASQPGCKLMQPQPPQRRPIICK
jgi:hypothetical protein